MIEIDLFFLSGLQSRASFMEESWCSLMHDNSGGLHHWKQQIADCGTMFFSLTYLLLWEVFDSVTHSSGRREREHAHFLEWFVCCRTVSIFLVVQHSRGYIEGYSFTDCHRESISVNWICLRSDGGKTLCTLPIVLLNAYSWTQYSGEPWQIFDSAFQIAEFTKVGHIIYKVGTMNCRVMNVNFWMCFSCAWWECLLW